MNWIDIKLKYPLAFKAFVLPMMEDKLKDNYDALVIEKEHNYYILGSRVIGKAITMPYHRLLYDFFDKFHIFVNPSSIDANIINVDYIEGKAKVKEELFTKKHKSRVLAEFEAFEIAFRMLEEKMKSLITSENKY